MALVVLITWLGVGPFATSNKIITGAEIVIPWNSAAAATEPGSG